MDFCRHCNQKPANRPRGLCWACYEQPAVRGQYPAQSPAAPRDDLYFVVATRPDGDRFIAGEVRGRGQAIQEMGRLWGLTEQDVRLTVEPCRPEIL